ncbi:MAG TPA: insulinase family protein [Croceibacterium sp.]|nr:insulinase family protein [Croceibacterium sp.]
MSFPQRAFGAFLALSLLAPAPLQAQQALQIPAKIAVPATPRYSQPDDPWIYRDTDIPIDKEWLFGEIPNGVRYAVRRNGVPPGQVSIRVRIDAGSLYERDNERGFAHLLEHLIFRQSKYLGNGEAIPHFQRLGASLGNDTNAQTTPTQTVYQLDLPNATPATLEESIRLLASMIQEPTLSQANVDTEVPIVLAERRERSGPDQRIAESTRELFFAGQRLAERSPIGTVPTLQAATSKSVRDFHSRWYRPERATVVAVGDADPMRLAALVEQYFGDWKVSGRGPRDPDFGDPVKPRRSDPANPVGEVKTMVEPGQPRSMTYIVLRPWHQVVDNLEYNRGLLIDAIAEAIVNRRLEARARAGGSYLYAQIQQNKISRSADATYVAFAPLTEDWQTPLTEVRSVIADALAEPPSQEEIDRELAQYDVIFANMVEQSRIQAGAKLADDIVNAVDIREAVASPETILEVFRTMRDRFTPEAIHEHTQALFTGEVVRAMLITPEQGEADAAALRTAMLAPAESDGNARTAIEALNFADMPPLGTPADPVLREPLGLFPVGDVEKLEYANGVSALLWPTDNEPGRATVRVRFGNGREGMKPEEGVYAMLGQMALVSSGFGSVDQNQIEMLAAGRKLSFNFRINEGSFVFEGLTRAEDVADQLYLFAAKLGSPRWDAQPFERARASALLSYDSLSGNPEGVINRDLDWLLNGRDSRFATPNPDGLKAATPEGFQEVWSRLLAEGPVEVDVFGDFDRETVVAALSRTFGAIPARQQAEPVQPFAPFPAANATPLVLTHRGEADQAAAVIAWPTGGGSDALPQSRKLEVLAQLFSNRLLDGLRERLGAAYSPYVGSTWPLDTQGGGNLLAFAQLAPEQVPAFFDEAEQIAHDLAANGPTADELSRVTEPMRQLLARMQTGHTFWLNQLEGATTDRNRLTWLPSLLNDYTRVTPEEMRALAARYLGSREGYRVAVMPQAAAGSGSGAAAQKR